jgi:hypothetical protein
MTFTGQNIRKSTGQKGLSFLLQDCSVNNLSGTGEFGFSDGGSNTIKFRFEEGNIFDFDDVNIFSYQEDSNFTISGDISSTHYSYEISDSLYSQKVNGKTKTDFRIEEFFINTTSCEISTSLKVLADEVPYYCQVPTQITKGSSFNVTVDNQSDPNDPLDNATIHIFGVSISGTASNYFSVDAFAAPITIAAGTSGTIGLTNYNPAIDSTTLMLNIDTNIGLISKSFSVNLYSAVSHVATNALTLINEVDTSTGKEFLYSFVSETLEHDPQAGGGFVAIDQVSTISLEYSSGNYGDFYEVSAISLSNAGGAGYINPVITFSKDDSHDVRALCTISAPSGTIDPATLVINEAGNYAQTTPTVTFSDVGNSPSVTATATAQTSNIYDKTFTGCFDLTTGTDPLALTTITSTQDQGDATYDFANFGKGMYEGASVNISESVIYYIKVIYTDTADTHAFSAKLKVTNQYPDSGTNQSVEEVTIAIAEPTAATTTSTTTSTTVAATTTTTTTAAATTTTTEYP